MQTPSTGTGPPAALAAASTSEPSGMAMRFCNCNVFILNSDFLKGSPFQIAKPNTYGQVTPPVRNINQLVLQIKLSALQTPTPWGWDQQHRHAQKLSSFKTSEKLHRFHGCCCSSGCHTRALDEHRNRPKTILQPSTRLLKK